MAIKTKSLSKNDEAQDLSKNDEAQDLGKNDEAQDLVGSSNRCQAEAWGQGKIQFES
jgi:hypothetical protein